MTEITEVVTCDGTCGLSPADCANLHPDPMTALKAQMVETVRQRLGGKVELFPHTAEFLVDGMLEQIEAHPALTIRHYAPTRDAYDAACRALEKHRARADEAEAAVTEVQRLHGKPRTARYGAGCIQCGVLWPCPTAKAVGITDPRPDRQGELPAAGGRKP